MNENTVIAPGVFDGLSALLAEQAKFSAIYASGGAIARASGYPDVGLLSLTEVTHILASIVRVTNIPVIADADTGFGNEINVWRTVQAFEKVGVAGLHLEDQTFPKRCGHLQDKSIISTEDMCLKIRVAKDSVIDPDFVIIARTDAIAIDGFDAAIERANRYQESGADVIFVEAPETIEQIEKIAKYVHGPKLINMFNSGKTPMLPTSRLQELGYAIVIIPSDLQRAAIKAMQQVLGTILKDGNSLAVDDMLVSFKEREAIVNTAKYLAIGNTKKN
jgi:2-methylisocitrate lyase-like PEP mutase family enzyme